MAIALAATLGLSSAAIVVSPVSVAQAAGTQTTQTTQTKATQRVAGDSVDYIADKFPGVGSGSVFDVVTYERLVRGVLRKDGKSVIVLGSPRNASTKAALPEINKVAKAKGIEKIYFFDPHLGGDEGKDGNTRTADTGMNDGAVTADHPRRQATSRGPETVRQLSRTGSATASIAAVAVGALLAGAALTRRAGRSRRRH